MGLFGAGVGGNDPKPDQGAVGGPAVGGAGGAAGGPAGHPNEPPTPYGAAGGVDALGYDQGGAGAGDVRAGTS